MKNWDTLEPDRVRLMTKHFTPGRGGKKIEHVTIHHMAMVGDLDACVRVWQDRAASAHYCIGPDGEIGQAVWDRDTAWSNANSDSNQRSITIEHSNSAGAAQDWPISDATREAGAHLVAAICKYYKLGRPVSGKNVRFHSIESGGITSCPYHLRPGQKYHDAYIARAQYWYDQMTGATTPQKENDMALFGPDQVGALNEAKLDSRTAVQKLDEVLHALAEIERRVRLVEDQLVGPEQSSWPVEQRNPNGGRGWPQLGVNKHGQWLTVVDFLRTLGRKVGK